MSERLQDMWRPVYEQWAALGWGVAAAAVAAAAVPYKWLLAGLCATFAAVRAAQAARMYRFRLAISGQRLARIGADETLERAQRALVKHHGLWLGSGFGWTPRHAQLARDVLDRSPSETPTLPGWLPDVVKRWLLPADAILEAHAAQGASWIHGLGPDERELYLPLPALAGHTLIVGTTRSGKTRLYELLTFQVVHSGAALIVIDPKGDKDWERRLRAECVRRGREFLYFHLAFPSQSIRINPLANWNNPSEIASRISQQLASEAGGDGFVDFADSTINRIVAGEVMVGERPTLKSIKHYVEHGVGELLERCFQRWFVEREGPNWDAALAPYIEKEKSRARAMVEYYRERYVARGRSEDAIDGLITIFTADRDWFSRVIVRLVPLLQRLATGELGWLLSPEVANFTDSRPVYTLEKIIGAKKVLYVGADMLANKLVGTSVLSMLLADLAAVAGGMYNFGGKQDVYLFVDEAAESVNDQLIQVMNKGGQAGFRVFVATQTLADFEARLGKRAKAIQVFGNTNNVIALRLRDHETARMIADLMGETVIARMNVSHSSGSETEAAAIEFRGTVSRTMKEGRAPLVAADVLMRLPNLQYFAMVAGGHIVKGRMPIIE